jgi:hypothetical protein
MSPLRARMIEDMILAGLAEGTQKHYVRAVRQLTAYYRRTPDQLSEEEVRHYLLHLRQRGVARGTFQIARYGLQFFYGNTLGHREGMMIGWLRFAACASHRGDRRLGDWGRDDPGQSASHAWVTPADGSRLHRRCDAADALWRELTRRVRGDR